MVENNPYVRTALEVQTLLQHAKLEETELNPITQVLSFPPREDIQDNYKFMEVDSSLLDVIQAGDSLVFRGDKEDNVVLCTKDRTYEVKEAETSNSLLLIPDLLFLQEVSSCHQTNRALRHNKVVGVFYKYFELRPCKPRLQKLRRILEESHYRGPEHEEDLKQSGIKIYSFEDLLECVQASEEELRAGLYESLACEIGGAWRILEHGYHFRVLSYILNLVEENSWPLNKVSRKETLKLLSNLVSQDILEQCFDWYTEPTGNLDFNGDPMYSLVEHKICRFFAEVLLKPASKFNLGEFFMSWQQSVPEGMKTSLHHLSGIALMDTSCKPEVIWYFDEMELPEDLKERFRVLFQTREKWTLDEIRPYVQRLATDKMNVNALLTKYSRAATVNGAKYYCGKHK